MQCLELTVCRRPATAQVGCIHHVVVDQRAAMQDLKTSRSGE
jgi:hypothetical protein